MERIPPEIKEFFEAFHGQSLLIKGKPGTGKTILALEILRELCEERNGLYISARMEPQRLYTFSPWIRDFIPERNIINATLSRLRRSLKLDTDLITPRTFDYGSMLEFFKAIYEDAEDMDNPMIIFDSWDGVLSHLNLKEEASQLTQGICDFCRDIETHIIFVTEQEEQTDMDFIVDGVVTLHRSWVSGGAILKDSSENLLVREMEINKLRGLPIRQSKYLFTLHEGRFRFFSPYIEDLSVEAEPVQDVDERHLSSGIHDLNGVIGGFLKGGFNLWELGYRVNKRYDQMLLQVCTNFIRKGCGIVGILPSGSILQKKTYNNLRVYQIETDDVNVETSSFLAVMRQVFEKARKPILVVISLDELENTFDSNDIVRFLGNIAKISEETPMVSSVLYLVKSGAGVSKVATHTVDTHIVLMDLDGALVLYGVRPIKGVYAVTSDEKGIHLTPIM